MLWTEGRGQMVARTKCCMDRMSHGQMVAKQNFARNKVVIII